MRIRLHVALAAGMLAAASAAAVGSAASSPVSGPAQQDRTPQATFGATIEVVQLQVTVRDEDDGHVPGLEAGDFTVRVDGKPRRVVGVYEVDLRDARAPGEAGPAACEPNFPPGGWRQFLLFFDLSFTTPRGLIAAREAAADFVRLRAHPTDLVAVATFSKMSGVQVLSPFTLDRAQATDAIASLGLNRIRNLVDPAGFAFAPALAEIATMSAVDPFAGEGTPGRVMGGDLPEEIRATIVDAARSEFRRYREDVTAYVSQLSQLGDLLGAVRGRKHVVLFSAGFDDNVLTGQSLEQFAEDAEKVQTGRVWEVNSESRFGSADIRAVLDDALNALRQSDAVIHTFDTSMLAAGDVRGATYESSQAGRNALTHLAYGTSGTVSWGTNDLTSALARLEEETSSFYVVTYLLEPEDPDVVDLEVGVTKAGARVTSSPSRLAPPPTYDFMSPVQRQMQLAEFVSKGIEPPGFSFDIQAFPFDGAGNISRVAVVAELPWAQLERFIAASSHLEYAEFEIIGYVLNERETMIDFFARQVSLELASLRSSGAGLPFRYYDLLWAPPGAHRVRVLVREASTGLIGTRTVAADVPTFSAEGLHLSGPTFIDHLHPGRIVRGIDPLAPPEQRVGGPLDYPFVLAGRELTPQVRPSVAAGAVSQVFVKAHNLGRHPLTGGVQASVVAEAVDSNGIVHPLDDTRLVGDAYDPRSAATTFLIEATMPASLPPGAYSMRITIIDRISGDRIERTAPFTIGAA